MARKNVGKVLASASSEASSFSGLLSFSTEKVGPAVVDSAVSDVCLRPKKLAFIENALNNT
jgi:hypothetical protein